MSEANLIQTLNIEGHKALFEGDLSGMIALCYENERPMQGLAGILDWRFQGLLSYYLRRGIITGKAGECAYIPAQKKSKIYHVILLGGGSVIEPGLRQPIHFELLKPLKKNLKTLGLKKIGISKADFGGVDEEFFSEKLEDLPLWVVQ